MYALYWLVPLIVLLLLVAIWMAGESTGAILYGPSERWSEFAKGFLTVVPNAQIVVLPEPEVDFTAYCDALEQAASKFRRLVCQVPNSQAAMTLEARRDRVVTVDSQLTASCVQCNIVQSEQAVTDALLQTASTAGGQDKKVVMSSASVRVPPGWMQLTIKQATEAPAALTGLGSLKLSEIVVTTAISPETVQALSTAAPGARIYALTETTTPVQGLTCQMAVDGRMKGKLAAMMCQAPYVGPRDVVVLPRVIRQKNEGLSVAPCTTLCQLATSV